jgi:hypothetical protein
VDNTDIRNDDLLGSGDDDADDVHCGGDDYAPLDENVGDGRFDWRGIDNDEGPNPTLAVGVDTLGDEEPWDDAHSEGYYDDVRDDSDEDEPFAMEVNDGNGPAADDDLHHGGCTTNNPDPFLWNEDVPSITATDVPEVPIIVDRSNNPEVGTEAGAGSPVDNERTEAGRDIHSLTGLDHMAMPPATSPRPQHASATTTGEVNASGDATPIYPSLSFEVGINPR